LRKQKGTKENQQEKKKKRFSKIIEKKEKREISKKRNNKKKLDKHKLKNPQKFIKKPFKITSKKKQERNIYI
jgi:hypothetical protein